MATWMELVRKINWFMVYYITVIHLGAIVGLTCLLDCKWSTLGWILMWYYLTGLGITMGAHRLWAHRSCKAHDCARFVLVLCNAIANQGTIFHWVRDHRVHHKYSDTPSDPHNSGRGFFFAHMGWFLVKKDKCVSEAADKPNYDDLWADWTVSLQQKFNPWSNLFMCFVFPTVVIVTVLLHGEAFWKALFITGFLHYVLVLHATWLVNSAAHFYGYRRRRVDPAERELVRVVLCDRRGLAQLAPQVPVRLRHFGIWWHAAIQPDQVDH
jgi:stearoyl-CoA desaturase (Delta-9 desaturase)